MIVKCLFGDHKFVFRAVPLEKLTKKPEVIMLIDFIKYILLVKKNIIGPNDIAVINRINNMIYWILQHPANLKTIGTVSA